MFQHAPLMKIHKLEELDTEKSNQKRYAIFRHVYKQRQYGGNHVTQRIKIRMEQHTYLVACI